MKGLFLYTEISGYFMACVSKYARLSGTEIHVIRWETNQEAPFEIQIPLNMQMHSRKELTDDQLISFCEKINPGFIYVAGRMDKGYLNVAKKMKKKGIPVIFGFDTKWTGSLRQKLAVLLSPFFLQTRFTHAWIPGEPQFPFAIKLGFNKNNILRGVYAGNIQPFLEEEERSRENKKNHYPHALLFCGRLIESKGVQDLIEAFLLLDEKERNDWKIIFVGTGPLLGHLPENELFDYRGFLQPEQLPALVAQSGAFILPSRSEPWGVALQEFAAGGLPLVASSEVGSASSFLVEGNNGFSFEAGNINALKNTLSNFFSLSDEKLAIMGAASRELSLQFTPETWAKTLQNILN